MCRNYVPSLTSSLDNPKVKIHIGDGFEFLKSTKEEFDVIINHSSHCEGGFVIKNNLVFIHKKVLFKIIENTCIA